MSDDSGVPSTTTGGGEDGGGSTPSPVGGGTDAGGEGGAGGEEGGATGEAVGFLGETTPWATSLPPTTAQASMTNGTVVSPTLDCMSSLCHATGGAGGAFLMAGFVATTTGGTTGAADVEVRIYANGTPGSGGYSAHTDSAGYFWLLPPATGAAGPYNGAVRAGPTGTAPIVMPAQQGPAASTQLDCQSASCHGGTTVGNIHI